MDDYDTWECTDSYYTFEEFMAFVNGEELVKKTQEMIGEYCDVEYADDGSWSCNFEDPDNGDQIACYGDDEGTICYGDNMWMAYSDDGFAMSGYHDGEAFACYGDDFMDEGASWECTDEYYSFEEFMAFYYGEELAKKATDIVGEVCDIEYADDGSWSCDFYDPYSE